MLLQQSIVAFSFPGSLFDQGQEVGIEAVLKFWVGRAAGLFLTEAPDLLLEILYLVQLRGQIHGRTGDLGCGGCDSGGWIDSKTVGLLPGNCLIL